MLVLTRKKGETIIVDGGTITITIVDIQVGGTPKVRIGVKAPDDITIHRGEVQSVIDELKKRKTKVNK